MLERPVRREPLEVAVGLIDLSQSPEAVVLHRRWNEVGILELERDTKSGMGNHLAHMPGRVRRSLHEEILVIVREREPPVLNGSRGVDRSGDRDRRGVAEGSVLDGRGQPQVVVERFDRDLVQVSVGLVVEGSGSGLAFLGP
jgi:hypothetical protein